LLGQEGCKLQCTPGKSSGDGVGENAIVPSFQDAFNEAFETAAQKGNKNLILYKHEYLVLLSVIHGCVQDMS